MDGTQEPGGEASGPLTIDEAVDALSSLTGVFDDEDDNPGEEEVAKPENEANAEDDEAEDEDGPEEDEAESEDDDADDDADDDDEDQAEEQSKYVDDTAVVLDADGNEITVADLKAGSLRHADYTRKTQELSEQRKQVETDLSQLNSYAKDIVQTLTLANELAKFAEPKPPSEDLKDNDPVAWTVAMHDYQQAKNQFDLIVNQVKSGLNDTQAVTGAHQKVANAKALEEGREKLRKAVPELADPEKSAAIQQSVWEVAQMVGFDLDEVRAWADPRIAHLAVLASRGKTVEQAKPAAKKKVEGKPPVSKPKKRATPKEGNRRKYNDARQRLASERSEDAAVAALAASGLLDDD